jgi:hypothetical protein
MFQTTTSGNQLRNALYLWILRECERDGWKKENDRLGGENVTLTSAGVRSIP